MGDNHQVYISYAWGGESERIVNELDADLQAKGILVIRDKRDLGFKGMIRDFMQQIGRGHAVIVVISDKYLKSPNCMYELVEIARNKDFYDRVFPIVLGDADIYNPVNRIKYIKHWEDKLKELDEAMRSVSAANLQGMRDEIDSYDEIRDNVSNLTFFLKDMNTLTPEMHENSNFTSLITTLEKRLAHARPEMPAVESAPASVKAPEPTPAAVAPAISTADFDAYINEVTARLTADGYEELRGERAGSIRFKKVMEMVRTGWLNTKDHFRVHFVQVDSLDDESFTKLEKDINSYGKALSKKLIETIFILCVVLARDVPERVKEILYTTKRPKVGIIEDVSIVVMVAYSAAENDIHYPSDLPDDYESNFEANIKKYLLP
jgi:hypothetical protein